jgi:hypothetical protein
MRGSHRPHAQCASWAPRLGVPVTQWARREEYIRRMLAGCDKADEGLIEAGEWHWNRKPE